MYEFDKNAFDIHDHIGFRIHVDIDGWIDGPNTLTVRESIGSHFGTQRPQGIVLTESGKSTLDFEYRWTNLPSFCLTQEGPMCEFDFSYELALITNTVTHGKADFMHTASFGFDLLSPVGAIYDPEGRIVPEIDVPPHPVPEPNSFWLAAFGLLMMARNSSQHLRKLHIGSSRSVHNASARIHPC